MYRALICLLQIGILLSTELLSRSISVLNSGLLPDIRKFDLHLHFNRTAHLA